MIKRLRKRFIRIATLSVAAVMLTLSLIVNLANFLSTDADLNELLEMICENQGTIPLRGGPGMDRTDTPGDELPPDFKPDGRRDPFNQETPYSTRYFCLFLDPEGGLVSARLEHIAAISDGNVDEYAAVARRKEEGFGYYGDYKFCVERQEDGRYLAVFLDCYQELRAVRTVALCSFAAMAACIVLVYILVVVFSRRAIDPVVRSAERQKQFITDAGHELKTPITVIATSLRVLEMETGPQKWIDKAMVQTEKLRDLVNSMVTLSRMDEEESPLRFEPFSVSDAVRETAGSFADYARSAGHELRISAEPDLLYCGDEYAVRQLVSILLDNAVKYAAGDSPIDFSLRRGKKGIVIRTANACGPLEPAELDRLFDRFYRADPSRGGTGGFGIGLSVARSIAEGHGGSIQASMPAEGRIEFTVRLRQREETKGGSKWARSTSKSTTDRPRKSGKPSGKETR